MIFEGSNEMLYTQISEMIIKQMKRLKKMNLSHFLYDYHLTQKTAGHFRSLTDFSPDENMPQRKQVKLGKILSRIIAADHVTTLGNKGFRYDLIQNSIDNIKQEVSALVNSLHYSNNVVPVEKYREQSSWLNYSYV